MPIMWSMKTFIPILATALLLSACESSNSPQEELNPPTVPTIYVVDTTCHYVGGWSGSVITWFWSNATITQEEMPGIAACNGSDDFSKWGQ